MRVFNELYVPQRAIEEVVSEKLLLQSRPNYYDTHGYQQ